MNKKFASLILALKIWFVTGILFSLGMITFVSDMLVNIPIPALFAGLAILAASLAGSGPVLIVLWIGINFIKKTSSEPNQKLMRLVIVEAFCTIPYAVMGGLINMLHDPFYSAIAVIAALLGCALTATFIFYPQVYALFAVNLTGLSIPISTNNNFQPSSKKYTTMETNPVYPTPAPSNKALIKGLIAGGLILLMLIPTILIQNLISEREARQKEVVQEVSAKWATAQTISGPYLFIPYSENAINSEGKPVIVKKHLIVLSKNMQVNGKIVPENRPRSIYKVLLYRSNLDIKGSFQPKWPVDINPATLDLANAKLCFGISDFKGIEEEIYINFNKQRITFSPGLPENSISETGLSVPVAISVENFTAGIPYEMNVKLKGSERLHFMPLSANSSFGINSTWSSPSFDGNTLPNERNVSDKGFTAKWHYNQANLPFGTVIRNGNFTKQNMSFGVSMVQPADQYNKTMRSVKYAVLIIGLTFALFFIIELMQGKPFHPVQYVLVGLALVIFYTLLLAISEYILFDLAYGVAAAATVILISLYAKSHFHSWKTAAIFGTVLSSLYGFIFILLSLEDTALLVGSIGLFIVLAVVMYVSRKVDWYGSTALTPKH